MIKIGMRNIKTAVAVSICIVLLRLLKMEYPFYACIASVISMQSSVMGSFTAGKNRMIGTSLGAFIGLLFALILPGNAILCGIGIIIVISCCNLLGKQKSATIACIVFLAVMVNLKGVSPYIYSSNRLLETFIGIAVSVLVNYFLTPPKYGHKLCNTLHKLIDELFIISGNMLKSNKNYDISKINNHLSTIENTLNDYSSEIKKKKNSIIKIDTGKNILAMGYQAYNHLYSIKSLCDTCKLDEITLDKFNKLYNPGFQPKPTSYKESVANTVFNYHVNELLDILYDLKNTDIYDNIIEEKNEASKTYSKNK